MEWIAAYWLEAVFGGLLALLAAGYRTLAKKLKSKLSEEKAVREGVLAILHDRLYQACRFYLRRGHVDIESLKNVEYLYKAYHALGGNGTGTELYTRVRALKIQED